MKPGSVIVDLAAESGGNCELTSPGADVVRHGVTILGPLNLAASCRCTRARCTRATCARCSRISFKDGALKLDFDDEITRGTCLTHAGRRMDLAPPAAATSAGAAPAVNPVGVRS